MASHFEIYRSGIFRKEWRWRLRAANGQIIATSGEGYVRREDAIRGVTLTQLTTLHSKVEFINSMK